MVKRITLLRRLEGMTNQEFAAHLLGAHADIARRAPNLRGSTCLATRGSPRGTPLSRVGSIPRMRQLGLSPSKASSWPTARSLSVTSSSFSSTSTWCSTAYGIVKAILETEHRRARP